MRRLFSVFVFFASVCGLYAQNVAELMTPCVYTNATGETLNYRLYVPDAIPVGKRVPLVLFMHGAGARGSDNRQQLRHSVSNILAYSQAKDPAIIIAPQCPAKQKWVDINFASTSHQMPEQPSDSMKLTIDLLKQKLEQLPVDTTRVYVTGVSMGGYATYDLIQRMPTLFAAAMPVCGGGDVTRAASLKAIPIWDFHGDQDPLVPVSRSRDMVKAVKDAGGNIKYREYPGLGHNVWLVTYGDVNTIAWLFSQKRPDAHL